MIDPRTLPDPLPIVPLAAAPDVDVVLPGSKSITNRALVCAALAQGRSTLRGALFADDTLELSWRPFAHVPSWNLNTHVVVRVERR